VKSHLEQVYKQTGRKPKELEKPYFPEVLGHVWLAFLELNPSRPMGDGVCRALPYSEIKSYLETTETLLRPREVQLLKALDNAYLEVING
jgi:hypothetical protein